MQRKENELYTEYCDRRKIDEMLTKQRLQPTPIWDSKEGTFVKAKHGERGTVYKTGSQKRAEKRASV